MSKRRGSNKENLEETRQNFIEIAQKEFTDSGYTLASTSRIVELSGMARGSLYYHFGDKNGLFKAVYEEMMQDALQKISEDMDKTPDSWDAFIAGSQKFLDLCMEKPFRKIILIESQAAMSFEERLKVQKKTLLGKLGTLLPELLEKGYFPGHNTNTVSTFLFGILGEIGRTLDFSDNVEAERAYFGKAFNASMAAFAAQANA